MDQGKSQKSTAEVLAQAAVQIASSLGWVLLFTGWPRRKPKPSPPSHVMSTNGGMHVVCSCARGINHDEDMYDIPLKKKLQIEKVEEEKKD